MKKDIWSNYPSSKTNGGKRADCGGMEGFVDVMNYSPPYGPKNMQMPGPGLRGGDNCGNCGTQGKYATNASTSGSPGLHGKNRSNSPTQGKR